MRVMDERLSPGVQHGEEADLGAEVARVAGNGAQRLGEGPEEQAVDDGLVLGGNLGDSRGTVKTTWKYSVDSRSARRRSSHSARASDRQLGQWRWRVGISLNVNTDSGEREHRFRRT